MEAHVTVIAPFRHGEALDDADDATLEQLFAGRQPFAFELKSVARFDDGTVYLVPTPSAPFVALTEAVAARFPEHPPYGGAFDAVVPHLTIARDPEGALAGAVRRLPLPIRAEATSVILVERGHDLRWQPRRRFALG
jgi:2'-5' RNA ligase